MTNRTDASNRINNSKRRRVSDVCREVASAFDCAVGDKQGQAGAGPSEAGIPANDRTVMQYGKQFSLCRVAAPRRRSKKRRRSNLTGSAVQAEAPAIMPHLDYGALKHVFTHCEGRARITFSAVNRLWRRVAVEQSHHHVMNPLFLHAAVQAAREYDTITLAPGLYKQRVLCSKPVKLASARAPSSPQEHLAVAVEQRRGRGVGCALGSTSVVFWQERPPAILCNCDSVCLHGITVRIAHSSHEYSSVAYGPSARNITLEGCHVMGSTGLRIPYPFDPLCSLVLNLRRCTISGIRQGLSGVTVVSGQLNALDCCVHDCTYGVEVGKDGHARLESTDICFTECALMCEGHIAMVACGVWANVATWQGRAHPSSFEPLLPHRGLMQMLGSQCSHRCAGPVVMEDDLPVGQNQVRPSITLADATQRLDPVAGPSLPNEAVLSCEGPSDTVPRPSPSSSVEATAAAGICNGRRAECVLGGGGIRHCAQLRLTGCSVEYERLKSTSAADRSVDADRSCRDIRRLMRQMYGQPDQDYEDWQIVVMSDMESEEDASDEDVEMGSGTDDSDVDDDDDDDDNGGDDGEYDEDNVDDDDDDDDDVDDNDDDVGGHVEGDVNIDNDVDDDDDDDDYDDGDDDDVDDGVSDDNDDSGSDAVAGIAALPQANGIRGLGARDQGADSSSSDAGASGRERTGTPDSSGANSSDEPVTSSDSEGEGPLARASVRAADQAVLHVMDALVDTSESQGEDSSSSDEGSPEPVGADRGTLGGPEDEGAEDDSEGSISDSGESD